MTVYRTTYTYACCSTAFTPVATPTDVFTIIGNGVTNVYVLKAGISTTQGTAGTNAWFAVKRVLPNTAAGTFTNPTIVPLNVNNPAANAVVNQYSANPTAAAGGGNVWAGWLNSPVVTTAGIGTSIYEIDFRDMFNQPVSLLTANDSLSLNFNGAALPAGLSVLAYFVWEEVSHT